MAPKVTSIDLQNAIRADRLQIEYSGTTAKDVYGFSYAVRINNQSSNHGILGYNNFFSRTISLWPAPKNMTGTVHHEPTPQLMAHTLAHELGHSDILPLELAMCGVWAYRCYKRRFSTRAFVAGASMYLLFIGESLTDVAASLLHHAPWSNNQYVDFYRHLTALLQ